MVSQAPNQTGTSPSTTVESGRELSVLLNDPIFRAIQDAFQLGWSIVELKSRIQIAALNSSIIGAPMVLSSINSYDSRTHELLQKVMPGVAHAQSRLLQSEENTDIQLPLPAVQPESARLLSLWRVIFNRIVESHEGCFPYSSTQNTYFDLPRPPDPSNPPNYAAIVTQSQGVDAAYIHLPYYYLYPNSPDDYATVGIPHDDRFPDSFMLYDVTRRALNCLTLIYTNSDNSLNPRIFSSFQQQLLQNISSYTELVAAMIRTTSSSAKTQVNTVAGIQTTDSQSAGAGVSQFEAGPVAANVVNPAISPDQQKVDAILIVSNHTIRYLENWDRFAREALLGSGVEEALANETQLVAYEAGYALASIFWEIKTLMAPIENTMNLSDELQFYVFQAWLKGFNESNISQIQLQISALGVILDAAFERINAGVQNPQSNTTRSDLSNQSVDVKLSAVLDALYNLLTSNKQNPRSDPVRYDLPSQSIEAIKNSLTYWQNAVLLLTRPPSPLQPELAASPSYKSEWKLFYELLEALLKQENIWQSLLLGRQSLHTYTSESITQKLYDDFMSQFQQAARPNLLVTVQTAHKTIRRRNIMLIGFGVLLAILLAGLLIPMFQVQNKALFSILVSTITVIFGFASTFADPLNKFLVSFLDAQSSQTKESSTTDSVSPIQQFTQAFGLTGLEMVTTFDKGYQQILHEFNDLNQNVSITYPLIEFFKKNYAIKDDYEFLTKIIWTDQRQQAKMKQRVLAAFGLLGTYVGAQEDTSDGKTSSSQNPKL